MPSKRKPRAGSLQYYPRTRAEKILPSINWKALEQDKKGILGAIGYKAGMLSAVVKDMTPASMTKGKQIVLPLTVLECPAMKVLSVRFYKQKQVANEVLAENLEKELKRKIKLPKKAKNLDKIKPEEYDDVRLLCYSLVKRTGIKKTPDISEIGLGGSKEEKLALAKELIKREIDVKDIIQKNFIIDIHGVTKGKGIQGPVKRFGISLRQHKSEKGVRKPGNLGPWKPAKIRFSVPMSGQMGFFTRVQYNNKVVGLIEPQNLKPFEHYGVVKSPCLLIKGSTIGPEKRALILTLSLRQNRKILKQNYEIVKIQE